MKKIRFVSCVLSLVVQGLFAQDKPILVTPQWLNEHLKDPKLVILQVNFIRPEYDREHIAGARHLWPRWLAPDTPEANFNAPDPREVTQVLRRLGISNDTHVVLCHVRNYVSVTARMFLTLEHLGLRGQVSFLNGGLEAWKKDGLPVTTQVPVVKKGKFKVKAGSLLVDRTYMVKSLNSPSAVIVGA